MPNIEARSGLWWTGAGAALMLLLCGALPAEVRAQQDMVGEQAQRVRTLVVYGRDPCPKASNPDEIIVCSRRPEEERYRLPQNLRNEATRSRTNAAWAARQRDLGTVGRTGVGSCSAVGPGGGTGCTLQNLDPGR